MAEKSREKEDNIDTSMEEKGERQAPPEITPEARKELEKIKEKLESFKKSLIKKFPFINSIGLLPPQATRIVEEEEEILINNVPLQDIPQEKRERLIHVFIILPDEKVKELGKVKAEAVKLVEGVKPKIWIHVKIAADLWEISFDGKYDYIEAIAMSFPIM